MKPFFFIAISLLVYHTTSAQTIPSDSSGKAATQYGNNPEAGKYFDVGDAKLYYEVYGEGETLLLLHGGVFGYIDEFSQLIADLSKTYRVVCLATRGHGKSEIGEAPYSYEQRATDAYKVIRNITRDSVIVLGFSDGGHAAYKLAATHPELVKKVIVIGAGEVKKGSRSNAFKYTSKGLLEEYGSFFKERLALMPEPGRWNESLQKLNVLYNTAQISKETFSDIKCPALIMVGDRDDYVKVSEALSAKEQVRNSQLAVIPGCSHVVFFCNYAAVWESIVPFLKRK